MLSIIYTILWFLLPLIPAYLIFRLLPSKAIVTGPLKGLNIDLSGAFAGYLLLFLISMPILRKLINKEALYEVWNVKGKVVDGETGRPIDFRNNPQITIQPRDLIQRTGDFAFKIIGERKGENSISFPIVEIEADGYMPQSLGSLDYKLGTEIKNEYCDEVDCNDKKASYKRIKLDRLPVIPQDQIKTVQDDTTSN